MRLSRIIQLLLGVVAGITLGVAGASAMVSANEVSEQQNTYTATKFDYIVVSPSNDQLKDFKNDTNSVKNIFPAYRYQISLKGKSSAAMDLLLSDQTSSYDISFFAPGRATSGQYSSDGLLLDQTAAKKLSVSVGDVVTFTLGTGAIEFSLPVSAIYSSVTYRTMDTGVGLATWTDAMAAAFSTANRYYDIAFIEAQDKTACATMLNDYKALGPLLSQDEYVTWWKSTNTKPSSLTDEEWTQSIINQYADYRSNYLAGNFAGYVQSKSQYMEESKDTTSVKNSQIQTSTVLFAIIVPLSFSLVSILVMLIGKRKDSEEHKYQNASSISGRLIGCQCCSVAISVVISICIILISDSIKGIAFTSLVLCYSLPMLASLVILIPASALYVKVAHAGKNNSRDYSSNNVCLAKGQRINSQKYGPGEIVSTDDKFVYVRFDNDSDKKIRAIRKKRF
jgi:hypothetical protein